MPKLNKALATKTAETETGTFDAIPEDTYTVRLVDVEQKIGKDSGKPYWNWKFEVTEGDCKGRNIFMITSLSENALFKLKEVFDAFGFSTDSDTDELVGESVKLVVIQEVIEKGTRKGQMGNTVTQVLSLDGTAAGDGGATAADDDLFEEGKG